MKYLKSARTLSVLLLLVLLVPIVHFLSKPAYGDELGNRSLQLTTNELSSPTQYALSFSILSASTLGSVAIQFCSNDPFPGEPCSQPAGLDASGAVLASQSGATGFSISNATTANQIILTRTPSSDGPVANRYVFTNVVNPSTPGTYFVRIQTYASDDASGNATDNGGIAFSIANSLSVTATVPPYLLFCTGVTITDLNCANAAGDYIDFGELSTTSSRSGTSQMLVGTNAGNGYSISFQGTTLTSGNNEIAPITTADVSRPGTPQFGLNLVSNGAPSIGSGPTGPGLAVPAAPYNQANKFQFASGDTIVQNPTTDDVRQFTASYIANVPKTQASGVYVSTITYICLANF